MRLILSLIVLFGLTAKATTYYVDYGAGSDTNAGTSTAAAWKHCPGDYAAVHYATNLLLAGDVVKFKGGVQYSMPATPWTNIYESVFTNGGIYLTRSGAAGNRIVLDGTGAGWGTGRAILDGQYVKDAVGIETVSGVSHIEIRGFEIRNVGGYADDDPVVLAAANGDYGNGTNAVSATRIGHGIYLQNSTNIFLSDLYVHRIGIWHHTIGWNGTAVAGTGIEAGGRQTSLTITNCEFTKCPGGIGVIGDTLVQDVLITDCYLHDDMPVWMMDIAAASEGIVFNNVTITKTRFMNRGEWTGTADDAFTSAPHQNYLFLRANGILSYWTNVVVSRCLFREDNLLSDTGGSGTIHMNNGASADIYNNLFIGPCTFNGVLFLNSLPTAGMTQRVRFFNNTVHRVQGGMLLMSSGAVGGNNLSMWNNLFIDATNITANASRQTSTADGPVASDYNIFWHPSFVVGDIWLSQFNGTNYQWAGVLAMGLETHSLYTDPLLVDYTAMPRSLRDYHPVVGSPAIAAGTNLTALGITTDYAGNARPASSAWTIGAYEFSGTEPGLLPPSGDAGMIIGSGVLTGSGRIN